MNESEDHNIRFSKTSENIFSFEFSIYLHRVIVKIGHNNFILVVNCNKVWTWMKREKQITAEFAVVKTHL